MMAHHGTLLYPDNARACVVRPPERTGARPRWNVLFPSTIRSADIGTVASAQTKGTGDTVDSELTTTELMRTKSWRQLIRRAGYAIRGNRAFQTSGEYWEQRYRNGGNSGAGSYSRLATFKAEILNDFVAKRGIGTVIEIGSGDGAQLTLAEYPAYTGVDVSHVAVESTRRMFADDTSKRFLHSSEVTATDRAELALSLDVIYHLVEDSVFESYLGQLFDSATRFVIVYSSNTEKFWTSPHVRHREFTRWVENNRADFELVETIPNRYPYDKADPDNTSFADFYIFERLT